MNLFYLFHEIQVYSDGELKDAFQNFILSYFLNHFNFQTHSSCLFVLCFLKFTVKVVCFC